MNILIDWRAANIQQIGLAAAQYGTTRTVRSLTFDGKNDIFHAHEILDSVETCFIGVDLEKCSCLDLIARALLSTKGVVLSNAESELQRHIPHYYGSLNSEQNIQRAPLNLGPGTGHWKEGVILLVGERPGKAESLGKRDATFFSIAASSQWLRQELMSIDSLSSEDFYFVNAFNRQDVETDWGFLKSLRPSKIFALGNFAAKSLQKAQIEHVVVSHPQHWKRFHSKKEYPLIKHLKQETNENQPQ